MSALELQKLEPRICMSLSFAPPVGSAVGAVSEMASGDFNRDGIVDLAVWGGSNAPTTSNIAGSAVRILAGSGKGKFYEIGRIWAGANVSDLEAADVNRDGRLDLVVANNNGYGTATVLLGNGDGTFRSTRSYFIGANPQDLAIGDFDNNGWLDIMAANREMWSPLPWSDMPSRFGAGLLRGTGFGRFSRVTMIPLIDGQTHVVTGDVDGNGRLDAVFGGPFSMSLGPAARALIHVALNRPTSTTNSWFQVSQFSPFLGTVGGLGLSDLDGDGRDDLAAVQSPGNNIGLATLHTFISDGDGTFTLKASMSTEVYQPVGLSLGDVDKDGVTDFVVSGADPRIVIAIWPPPGAASVMLGTGGGGIGKPTLFATGRHAAVQVLADLNNDGLLDIVTGGVTGVSALLNTTDPTRPPIGLD
jgi:hypothetical protein